MTDFSSARRAVFASLAVVADRFPGLLDVWDLAMLLPEGRAVTPAEFKARTRAFAIDVIRFAKAIPKDHINVSNSACAMALPRAACRARSKADFIAKMGIVEEELDESLFWFDLLVSSKEQVPSDDVKRLWAEADELLAMTVQSIRTARGGSR